MGSLDALILGQRQWLSARHAGPLAAVRGIVSPAASQGCPAPGSADGAHQDAVDIQLGSFPQEASPCTKAPAVLQIWA